MEGNHYNNSNNQRPYLINDNNNMTALLPICLLCPLIQMGRTQLMGMRPPKVYLKNGKNEGFRIWGVSIFSLKRNF